MGDEEPIGVGGEKAAEIGSARLALALANQDLLGIGQALRHDYVVAPILRSEDGEAQVLVTTSTDPSERQFVLPLYSSAHTLQLAFPEAEKTEFALRQGASLVDVLEANSRMIQWVSFDQAGPNPVWATAEDVRDSLAPRIGDDEVAWAVSAGMSLDLEQIGDVGAEHPAGIDLATPATWVPIELATEADRVDGAVAAAKVRYPRRAHARRREEAEMYLLALVDDAAAAGARSCIAAAPDVHLVIVVHWHEIGPSFGGTSHLERVASRWAPGTAQEHRVPMGTALSHEAPDGVDYWLPFPDGRGLCQLQFIGADAQTQAADLVAAATWSAT